MVFRWLFTPFSHNLGLFFFPFLFYLSEEKQICTLNVWRKWYSWEWWSPWYLTSEHVLVLSLSHYGNVGRWGMTSHGCYRRDALLWILIWVFRDSQAKSWSGELECWVSLDPMEILVWVVAGVLWKVRISVDWRELSRGKQHEETVKACGWVRKKNPSGSTKHTKGYDGKESWELIFLVVK